MFVAAPVVASDGSTKAQAAPVSLLSRQPPISAVLPSPESATVYPNQAALVAPVPISFPPCWVQVVPERVKTQAAPLRNSLRGAPISAVLPSAERATLSPNPACSGLTGTGELFSLLGPGRARASEDPRRPDVAAVAGAADQRGVAVGGQRHARAEFTFSGLACADELCCTRNPSERSTSFAPWRTVTWS